ncbi:DUF2207 domain-containing protein [Pseudactinotalea sp. Z1732]|uniref:DUF2207 domain-containing protein n=1 Tax=Micrococcales TaxID=85006 RepID=UPI003C7A1A42
MTVLRSALLAVAVAVLTVAGVSATAAPTQADARDDVVRALDVEITIDAGGLVHVTETYEWDFGDRDGLGLRRELAQRFAWPHDPDLMRLYRYDQFDVHSPSGAPAEHWISERGAYLRVDIGAPDGSDDTRTGVQTYELGYTIAGALNAIRDDDEVPDQDEFFWNVTGDEWEVRFDQVTTTVTGPVDITDHRCWEGPSGSDQPCAAEAAGSTATFATGTLRPGQQQTVAVAFPAGTFDDIEPILVPAEGDVVGLTAGQERIAQVTDPIVNTLTTYWPVPVGAVVLAYALLLVRRYRQGRDDHFVGIPPGTFPPPHARETHPVAQLQRNPPETVRFQPPEGLAPAVASRLEHKVSDAHALAATIVDLAVRGFLTIREAKTDRRGRAKDWDVTLAPDAAQRRSELAEFEDRVLIDLFATQPTVRLSKERSRLTKLTTTLRTRVAEQIDAQGLFTRPVSASARRKSGPTRRGRSLVWQIAAAVVLLGTAFVGTSADVLPPSAVRLTVMLLIVLGLWLVLRAITFVTSFRRSATGRALYEQLRGFKMYLSAAEANQIRFEEGIDVFSRYLPYAIVFGVAERWAKIFEELQAQGRAHVNTGWYVGFHPGAVPSVASIASSMNSFVGAASPTSGSSGGSGFGGGGGAGGGGGGGGGGGR